MFLETSSRQGEISGHRHFIYCLVCALLCICSFIDIDITGRDNGVEFGIYIFITRDFFKACVCYFLSNFYFFFK